jgi:hypothetical protein
MSRFFERNKVSRKRLSPNAPASAGQPYLGSSVRRSMMSVSVPLSESPAPLESASSRSSRPSSEQSRQQKSSPGEKKREKNLLPPTRFSPPSKKPPTEPNATVGQVVDRSWSVEFHPEAAKYITDHTDLHSQVVPSFAVLAEARSQHPKQFPKKRGKRLGYRAAPLRVNGTSVRAVFESTKPRAVC